MPPAPKPSLTQEGLVLVSPTADNVHPDVFLRDVIIALDKFPAFSSKPGHIATGFSPPDQGPYFACILYSLELPVLKEAGAA